MLVLQRPSVQFSALILGGSHLEPQFQGIFWPLKVLHTNGSHTNKQDTHIKTKNNKKDGVNCIKYTEKF